MIGDTLIEKSKGPLKKLLKDLEMAFEQGDFNQALMKSKNIEMISQACLVITQLVREDI